MANGNLGSYAVTLPDLFQAPGQALQSATEQVQRQGENLAQMQMRKQEAAERRAEKEEAKKYRDMKMVADYGDLSKFQTASDFANAVGAAKVADVKKKYFDQVKNGNLDLSEMDRDFSAITQGMAGLKTEQLLFEQLAKQKQELIPGFDVSKFLLDARKDSVARRIKDGTDFINPLEVKSSDILIKSDDPEFISQYVSGGKALTEAIQAPKGMEKSAVFSGTPMENVRFEAQIPFWKKSSFVPEQAPGGFLPKGVTPKLEIKSSVLPAESIKDSEKAPFRVVDEDVFNVFAQNPATNVELIQATRQQYPSYDTFNQVEKQYAKRKVLYDKLADIDKSDFYATASTRAPITNVNIPKEEKGLEGLNWVKNFKTALESKDTGSAIAEARKLFAGAGGKYDFKDLKIAPDGGLRFIYYDDYTGEDKDVKISPNDPNKYYKIANLYQNITGQDVKMERKVLGGKEDLSTPAQSGKITVILDGKLGEIPANNWEAFKKKYPNAKRQ